MARAKIITFDGHDGVGKSTIIREISLLLKRNGHQTTSFKTMTGDFEKERNLTLQDTTNIWFYFTAWLNVEKSILEHQDDNDFLLIDRSYYSTMVLGTAKGVAMPDFLLRTFIKPDLAVWVCAEESIRLSRLDAKKDISVLDIKTKNEQLIKTANEIYSSLNLFVLKNDGPVKETTKCLNDHIKSVFKI